MLCIHSPNTDIFFNLAAEEYLFKNYSEDFFMLWRNEPCIVVGKHQNTMAEINHNFVDENRVHVARRLSGGGTVYHDEGNLNFTFITKGQEGRLVDFKKFIDPVQNWLLKHGVETKFEGKNNVTVSGRKISGNAEHVFKNRVLHHGTLLYASELGKLSEALKVDLNAYTDKAVKSIRNPVTNISDYMDTEMSIEDFQESLMDDIKQDNVDSANYEFSQHDLGEIQDLIKEKYSSWDWIYGYSPPYTFSKTTDIRSKYLSVWFKVERGFISEAILEGNYHDNETNTQLGKSLVSQSHTLSSITTVYESLFNGEKDSILSRQELISIFF